MCALRVSMLGYLQVDHGDEASAIKVPQSVRGLLAYLLLQRDRSHPRAFLAGLLWGDHPEERARSCLSTALWRLRQVFEPEGVSHGTYLITTAADEIRFNQASDHWIDVMAFEQQCNAVLARPLRRVTAAEIEQLERGLQLYTGDLLEGFYDNWVLKDRDRLRNQYMNTLNYLMHYHRDQGTYAKSLMYGQRLLHHDPLREEVYREMMQLYVWSGQRPLAVRQYETCREILRTELGIAPMEQTQALYAEIVTSGGKPASASPSPAPQGYEAAIEQLHVAMRALEEARIELRRAIDLAENMALSLEFVAAVRPE